MRWLMAVNTGAQRGAGDRIPSGESALQNRLSGFSSGGFMKGYRAIGWALVVHGSIAGLSAIAMLAVITADVSAQRRVAPDSLRQIQEVAPLSEPPGTVVTLYTENVPLQAKVHLGVGATRTGSEALHEAEQGTWGEVSGSITIPETAPWNRAVLLVAFDAIFAPIGLSEPFHVTRPDGILERTGEMTGEGVECPAMRDTDGFLYTLIGNVGDLEAGDLVVVEARYVETSICMQGTTLEVVRVLPPPSG